MQLSAGRKRERLQLLEALVPRWRERFLDRADSCLWELVERGGFEALTAPSCSQRLKTANSYTLFQVGTAFTYEDALRTWVEDWQPPDEAYSGTVPMPGADVTPVATSPE